VATFLGSMGAFYVLPWTIYPAHTVCFVCGMSKHFSLRIVQGFFAIVLC